MPDDFCMLFQFQREWNVLCTIESLNKFVSSAIVQWIFQCFDTFLLIFFIRRLFYFRFVWFFVLLLQQFWIFWRLFHLVSCLHNVTLVYFAKSTRILRTYISENTERFWKFGEFNVENVAFHEFDLLMQTIWFNKKHPVRDITFWCSCSVNKNGWEHRK